MDGIRIPYIVKGIIKNYRLDNEEKVLQLLRALYSAGVVIDVYEARGKFVVIVNEGYARIFSEELDISQLNDLVEKIKQLGYIHIGTDLLHSYEPIQRMVFINPLFADKQKLREVLKDV